MADKLAGYFIWCRGFKGKPFPKKLGPEFVPLLNKDSQAEFERHHIGSPIALTEDEFKLNLDQLGEKYPPPKESEM